jgi:predicted ArsR family transcriptional regulator
MGTAAKASIDHTATTAPETHLETGVDRLLRLVAEKKRIELGAAAAELGVSPDVVRDWVNFLEQDGLVGVSYSLSKTYLSEKHLTKEEVAHKTKEYEGRKEAFIRKVNVMLSQIDDETQMFEKLKEHSENLQHTLGDLSAIEYDVELLNHFEDLKKCIDDDIARQKLEYKNAIDEIHAKLDAEENRYTKILDDIENENKAIKLDRSRVDEMRQEEDLIMKRIDALQETLKTIKASAQTETTGMTEHEQRLQHMRELAENLHTELAEQRKKSIDPLILISQDQEKRILRLQDDIIAKVKARYEKVEAIKGQTDEATKELAVFFQRRSHIHKSIADIEKEELSLRQELVDFILKAKAFDLAVQDSDMNSHIQELSQKFVEFATRKKEFNTRVEELKGLLTTKAGAKQETKPQQETKPPQETKPSQETKPQGARQ